MEPYIIIISLASIIIISHFLNLYSNNTGVPSVLLLILFGMLMQLDQVLGVKFGLEGFEIISESTQKSLLSVLGVGGLILILLEAALDLEINKKMLFNSFKAFIAAFLGLVLTAFSIAHILKYFSDELDFMHALLYAIPLSILSSAIIIPSIQQGFSKSKKSFLIYESTFSDVLGLLAFQILISSFNTGGNIHYQEVIGNIVISIIFSIIISVILIYLFQKIKGHVKLFLLFSILILTYSIGKILHLSSLLIILIFGIVLNNYKSFFVGFISKLIDEDIVSHIQEDFKIIIAESAFVVRTFFFIVFGYYVQLGSLGSSTVIIISLVILFSTYLLRSIVLLPTLKGKIWPEIFLAPRGLITILLFFSIPDELVTELTTLHQETIPGILLFVILGTSLIMSNALINVKKIELAKIALEQDVNLTLNIDPNRQDDHSINNEDGKTDDMEIKADVDSHDHQSNTHEETKSQDDQINISE